MSTAPARSYVRWLLDDAAPRVAMRRAARRGDLQARMLITSDDEALLELFEQIRSGDPVYRGGFGLIVTSHAGVKQVLGSPDFGVGVERIPVGGVLRSVIGWAMADRPIGPVTPPALLAINPPQHTRCRALVSRVFTARAVQRLRERTQQITAGLLDDLEPDRGHTVDLVNRF